MNGAVSMLTFSIAFVVGVVACPLMIPVLRKMKFGQNIRQEGPKSHLKKSGTPTMGGIVIIAAFLLSTLPFSGLDLRMLIISFSVLLFGLIGLSDDMLKIKKHQSEGLKAWQKLGLQVIVSAALIIVAGMGENGTEVLIPFAGTIDLHGWFYPVAFIAVLGTVNGSNFTDGLDGLLSSVGIVIAGFFAAACIFLGSGLTPAAMSMSGALLAFLCFNCYPAKVFMGDTGSLSIGGFAAAFALVLKMPVFLVLAAIIYLAEIVSVIIQVLYFKITHGKRFFRMAPLHHHFELGGWPETKVVTIFTIVTVVFCILAFAGLYVVMN